MLSELCELNTLEAEKLRPRKLMATPIFDDEILSEETKMEDLTAA